MIDLNSKSMLTERINHLIDKSIDAHIETPRTYLGASIIGNHCERSVQYAWMGLLNGEAQSFPARIKRIFNRGNIYEEECRRWLKDAGFLFGFVPGIEPPNSFADGNFRGHADGVITGWKHPDILCPIELPALWEHKCLGNKSWKKLKKERLREFSPTYYDQTQIYMHKLGLRRCLFTATNADTMEIYHELVEYNEQEALMLLSRVERVFTATQLGEMLPRHTMDRNHFICKWCDYSKKCWEGK